MNQFSKAETLKYLRKFENQIGIKIPKSIFFTKRDFQKNSKKLVFNIEKYFKNKKIIIRSSALNEDTSKESNAGKYKSFENINARDREKIISSIEVMIKDFRNLKDQILVQEFISNPNIAGVIFTRSFVSNSPYYVINYDKSGKTNLITSGKNNPTMKTLYIYKDNLKNGIWKKNLNKINLLEKKIKNDRLDIEFCIKKKIFYLLQCRPLKKRATNLKNDKILKTGLKNIQKKIKKFIKPTHNLIGNKNCFSNMSDWNPAEMIGIRPSVLAHSLYCELITDEVWAKQRKDYGYKDVRPNPLMLNFGGSPYIDLRVDFNSFIPASLPTKIQKKAIDYYLNRLKKNPKLQDKIEFDVVETCYDFKSKDKIALFLNKKETKIYLKCLKNQLNNIISNKSGILEHETNKISFLEKKIIQTKNDKISDIQKIYFLVNYCKKYGTLPFAGIARCAFISTKLLRTILELGVIDEKDHQNFYESIQTIAKKIYNESSSIKKNSSSRNNFLRKYGHIRPSMYNISSKNYRENFKNYFFTKNNANKKKFKKFILDKEKVKNIDKLFKNHKLNFNCKSFFKFAKRSIELRELSKMVFSKSIDEIFNSFMNLSKKIHIKRDDLEYVSIKKILELYSNLDIDQIRNILNYEIKKNKSFQEITNLIEFPEFINSSNDIYSQELKNNLSNYVTKKNITGELLNYENIKNFKSMKNKIILLKNADPGYDFIFSHDIKGLITEYGGANSHMSIRCLELGIPAIIGIGTKNFQTINKNNFVQINANQKYFKIVR